MIRELMMNALEAARHAPAGRRLVEISAQQIDGASKLTMWNTGPGMDAVELHHICNIASSIGKEKSLTGNFGMGAKVASLPSNQRGMRYRSCKNGRVHEVILCKRDGVYGRLRRFDPTTGEYLEVIDVTDIAVAEGRSLRRGVDRGRVAGKRCHAGHGEGSVQRKSRAGRAVARDLSLSSVLSSARWREGDAAEGDE